MSSSLHLAFAHLYRACDCETKKINVKKERKSGQLTQAGRPIGGDLVSHGANALEAAFSVDTVASTAQQGVPFTLVNV